MHHANVVWYVCLSNIQTYISFSFSEIYFIIFLCSFLTTNYTKKLPYKDNYFTNIISIIFKEQYHVFFHFLNLKNLFLSF